MIAGLPYFRARFSVSCARHARTERADGSCLRNARPSIVIMIIIIIIIIMIIIIICDTYNIIITIIVITIILHL